jgi:hypothetical protein
MFIEQQLGPKRELLLQLFGEAEGTPRRLLWQRFCPPSPECECEPDIFYHVQRREPRSKLSEAPLVGRICTERMPRWQGGAGGAPGGPTCRRPPRPRPPPNPALTITLPVDVLLGQGLHDHLQVELPGLRCHSGLGLGLGLGLGIPLRLRGRPPRGGEVGGPTSRVSNPTVTASWA